MSRCVALLGGSFDPVHLGHVALAQLFANLLQPDELRVMPAGQPWQKSGLQASDADRVAMLELAFAAAGLPVTIDRQELERGGPTYTVDTLRALRATLGADTALVFLMGADQLHKLDTWRDWRSLFTLAHFAVAARPGYRLEAAHLPPAVAAELAPRLAAPEQLRTAPAGRVCIAPQLAVDISSTAVRAALAGGGQANELVTPRVLDYIQQHHLYKK